MERLQEAIARARRHREGEVGQLPPFEEVLRHEHDAPRRTGRRRAAEPVPGCIAYSRTRQVTLDPELLDRNRVVAGRADDQHLDAYRRLRAQVLRIMARGGWRSLAITSPWENAGKTLTAVNLAIVLAQEVNQTVLLVDLDLQRPRVHRLLGVEVEAGLVDVLESRTPLEQALFNPGFQRLVVLPGRPCDRGSELLTSPAMKVLLRELVTRYESRLILFDLPPLLRKDDAMVIAPLVEATLLVVEDGCNTPDDVERSMHMLTSGNLIGTVLNKAR